VIRDVTLIRALPVLLLPGRRQERMLCSHQKSARLVIPLLQCSSFAADICAPQPQVTTSTGALPTYTPPTLSSRFSSTPHLAIRRNRLK
jgi:hypothetical protein